MKVKTKKKYEKDACISSGRQYRNAADLFRIPARVLAVLMLVILYAAGCIAVTAGVTVIIHQILNPLVIDWANIFIFLGSAFVAVLAGFSGKFLATV